MTLWLRFRYPRFFFTDIALLADYHRTLAATRQAKKTNKKLRGKIDRLKEAQRRSS